MITIEERKDTPVWTIEGNCKGCDICVSVCPAGVLVMKDDNKKVLGKVSLVENPESCIGCNECQIHCPDFAIFVADRDKYKFAKITDDAKARAQKIVENKFKSVK